ncbi:hypothetical protein BGZ90_009284, partial [Linnemannia elongata]
MDDARRLLDGCTTFDYSYEQHWIERAELIKAMVAVYIPGSKVFAYCHWWSSVTRKYGYMWSKVSAPLALHLVANYSFNDRPIYYVEAKVSENGTVKVTKEMYEREPGCKAKTLVPGGSKGMFPSYALFDRAVYKFADMGIVPVDNIRIRWPKRRHHRPESCEHRIK